MGLSLSRKVSRVRRVDVIAVPQSAVTDAAGPMALADRVGAFVRAMLTRGAYTADQLPTNAMRIYWANVYCTQVMNGGHRRFAATVGSRTDVVVQAREGLEIVGAHGCARCLADLLAFTRGDPEAVRRGSPSFYAALDRRFFAANRRIGFQEASRRAILRFPELEVVPDANYAARIKALVTAHPRGVRRELGRRAADLHARLLRPLTAGLSVACIRRDTECGLLGVWEVTRRRVQGRQTTVYGAATTRGTLHGCELPGGVLLFDPDRPDGAGAAIAVSREHVDEAVAHAAQHGPSYLAVAMAHRSGVMAEPVAMAYCAGYDAASFGEDGGAYAVVLDDGSSLILFVAADRAALTDPAAGGRPLMMLKGYDLHRVREEMVVAGGLGRL